jgi:hypothetical protein
VSGFQSKPVSIIVGLSVAITLATLITHARSDEKAKDVSLVALIATPERFQGTLIRTSGYLRLEFEGDAIFMTKSDADHRISKNGLWVSAEEFRARKNEVHNRYVFIEGRFSAQILGHMDAYSGAITNVTGIIPIND